MKDLPQALKEKLDNLPAKPGCYLYKDDAGRVIYVGKAVNLRSRVRSYFQKSAVLTLKTRRLVEAVRDVETIVVGSELEALVLECNLIKKHQPHYNVRLRDDKQYPYLCITLSEPFPRLLLTRRVRSDGNKYFGPYSSSRSVHATMDLIKRIFPIVSCGKPFDGTPVQKPCLYYHMGQCLAPCAGLANQKDYHRAVHEVIAFLQGRPDRVVKDLQSQMEQAAAQLNFERAARLRDQMRAIQEVMTRQQVVGSRMVDQDVIAVVGEEAGACVQMFYIRGGKLVGQNAFVLDGTGGEEPSQAVQEFVKQYYRDAPYVPKEILLPCNIDEAAIIETWLKQRKGATVHITVPARGDKKRLVEMAAENALHAFRQIKAAMRARLGDLDAALEELAQYLGLDAPPSRIECYDISHFGAEHFVGSMVVFLNGEAAKQEYRRFKIRGHQNKPDDPAMIAEVVSRRLAEAQSGNPRFNRLPNLLIVDGGPTQVSAAEAVLKQHGFASSAGAGTEPALPLCGLAKRFEHLYLPGRQAPVVLPRNSQALFLLQRIRDEAHRFANQYRKTLQSHKHTNSVLETVPGIGPRRRKALLKRFGSIEHMRQATLEELASAPGMNRTAAAALLAALQSMF
ncbi:MAG: excinuclease ABC subunit UvrC [Chthonomonadales bacterium]